jgi:hypothetical protein
MWTIPEEPSGQVAIKTEDGVALLRIPTTLQVQVHRHSSTTTQLPPMLSTITFRMLYGQELNAILSAASTLPAVGLNHSKTHTSVICSL